MAAKLGHSMMRSWLVAVAAALVALPAGARPAQAMSVERLETGRTDVAVFLMKGGVQPGDTLRLQREVSKLPSSMPVSVVLDSPGGSLAEGLDLGRFFYNARITTIVMGYGSICYSACSLAFLGGRDRVTGKPSRIKMINGDLGFHQYRQVWSEEAKKKVLKKADVDHVSNDARQTIYAIISYLAEIGEDMSKLHLMLKAPSEEMHSLGPEDAVNLGIHVMYSDRTELIESSSIRERVRVK